MKKEETILYKIWEYLIKIPIGEPIEKRILNSVCIFSFLGILVCITSNCLIGLTQLAAIQSSFLVLQVIIYYLSRFARQFLLASILYAISGYLFLTCNYFYNDGLTGPTLLAFFVLFHFLVSITPERINWIWVPVHILVIGTLSFVEIHDPLLVRHSYPNNVSKFIDINFTFYVLVGITYLITRSIRKKYFEERRTVASQKATIEEKNIKLEHIDKERNRLFSIISHDLRSPLSSIQGYLELLHELDETAEGKKEIEQELLSLNGHTLEMLGNLLQWSKAQLESNTINFQPLNVVNTLSSTIEIQSAIALKKQIGVVCDIPPALNFIADKDRMELVIRNLLSNAIKFTNPGGLIQITAQQEEDNVLIMIADNGSGIPEIKQPYIFTSQITSSLGTLNEKGIGLGLLLCKEFIEDQNGTVSFDSKEGAGTRFYISLQTVPFQ